MSESIGFIGGGNMAASIIGGLSRSPDYRSIWVYDPNAEQTKSLQNQFAVTIAQDNAQLVEACATVVLAVKPQIVDTVLKPLANAFAQSKPLLISVVAGVTVDSLQQQLQQPCAMVRFMPNTPALIGLGATGLFANSHTSTAQKARALVIAQTVGIAQWVDEEAELDIVTGLSGSGPAYFMLFINHLIDAATKLGLPPTTAKNLALQTARGASELISSSDESIQTLIDRVTSPNGTTHAALQSFARDDLRQIVANAVNAATHRSFELGNKPQTGDRK